MRSLGGAGDCEYGGAKPGRDARPRCTGGARDRDCGGPDYGVVWKGATVGDDFAGLALTDSATMNIATGFDGGLSFDYYNLSNFLFAGSVNVYSGTNGHGDLLASAGLGATPDWDFINLFFSGTAKSVVLNGSPFFLAGFDNVTLGLTAPVHPVAEPATLGVFGFGLLLMGAFVGLRRRCG
jgi:hypothetical protein